jgi:hypothetical protein
LAAVRTFLLRVLAASNSLPVSTFVRWVSNCLRPRHLVTMPSQTHAASAFRDAERLKLSLPACLQKREPLTRFLGSTAPSGWSATLPQFSVRIAKNNRSKSACTNFQRKRLSDQAVWPVILRLTGPICARALNRSIRSELAPRGHHDWPVKRVIRPKPSDRRSLEVL